ncbi:UTRA domain-containing protein [Kitasatospora sp. NPDC092948]|uniref:UTRA domain-containing protein n=1 Tax=Kitasatospora sp. NPDC092948 TaxID=3364088 RepID=UPI0037F9ECB0
MAGAGWTSSSSLYAGAQAPGAAWEQEAASAGQRGTHRVLEAGLVEAPECVAALLGAQAVVRRRSMDLDGRTVELTDSYFRADIAAGTALARPAKIKGGPARVLRELGVETPHIAEEIEARPAAEAEREALQLPDNVWVLVMHRICRTTDGQPVQVDVMVASALHQRLRYEMRTDGMT